jgi:DNA-binding response OmpR family regulator
MRVLVVDDNEDLRRLITNALEFAGHEPIEAAGGDEARSTLEDADALPDAIVLDVQMPVVDGWDTLSAIRSEPRTQAIPVVMCTVKSRLEDIVRGFRAGCDGYLIKPFDIESLVREVETAAGRDAEARASYRRRMIEELRSEVPG